MQQLGSKYLEAMSFQQVDILMHRYTNRVAHKQPSATKPKEVSVQNNVAYISM